MRLLMRWVGGCSGGGWCFPLVRRGRGGAEKRDGVNAKGAKSSKGCWYIATDQEFDSIDLRRVGGLESRMLGQHPVLKQSSEP